MQPSARRALNKTMDKIDNWSMSTGVALESQSVQSSEYASLIGQAHPHSEMMPPPSSRSTAWLVGGFQRGVTSKINSIPYINSIIHSNAFLAVSNRTSEFLTATRMVFKFTPSNWLIQRWQIFENQYKRFYFF